MHFSFLFSSVSKRKRSNVFQHESMRRTNIVFQSKKSHRLMALALSAVVGLTATFAAAETVTPTGNTYGFAGTNARYYTDYMTTSSSDSTMQRFRMRGSFKSSAAAVMGFRI